MDYYLEENAEALPGYADERQRPVRIVPGNRRLHGGNVKDRGRKAGERRQYDDDLLLLPSVPFLANGSIWNCIWKNSVSG